MQERRARTRPGRRRGAVLVAATMLAVLVPATATGPTGAAPATMTATTTTTEVPGTGAARPRLLYRPGAEDDLRDRLQREPYRSVFLTTHARAASWQGTPLGDLTVGAQRNLLRVAKVRAFEVALDRTVVGGEIVPFPDDDARRAAGDQARDILLQMLDRSRLAVPPPIGGWDRDISSSEEIVMAAQAFDLLLAAGHPLSPADHDEIVRRIAAAARELRLNFVEPATANRYAELHQNNHRTKTGTALAVAAVALAGLVGDAGEWFDTGVDLVDDTLRHVLLTGDGAYAEGPFYFRYTTQNLIPYLEMWDRHLGDGSWTTAEGIVAPPLLRHPLLARTQRWMLDTTVPDGSMAPIDDGNPGRAAFHGAMPTALGSTAAGYWQWHRAPDATDIDGNITLGPDTIVAYDDTVVPAPPDWEPTQVYVEGGTATLRSDWGADAAMAIVLGEHDTASEFGRDREGVGRWPQSHEHAEPGAFMLYAYGERLALDPGYLTFGTHDRVNRPEHHNVVLVDGAGPPDYLGASLRWSEDPMGRPPAEGHATLSAAVVSPAGDAVSVSTAYRRAMLDRRVVFGGDRYLVVSDTVEAPDATDLTWMLHGNGGGTSGGTYEATEAGGRWTIGGARLDSGIAVSTGAPVHEETEMVHEVPRTQERTHTALAATAPAAAGGATAAVQVLYPTRSGDAPPTIERTASGDRLEVVVTDAAAGRVVTTVRRTAGSAGLDADGVATDGSLLVVERTTGGALISVWAEEASRVTEDGRPIVVSPAAGTLALGLDGDRAHVVADTGAPTVEVAAPAGTTAVDGGCGVERATDGTVTVALARTRSVTVHTGAGSVPGADAGADRRVDPGTTVAFDGGDSCDADGDGLTPRWELVSAPRGSAWSLRDPESWAPTLDADVVGPYRARLVVTDSTGRTSSEDEVVVIAGDVCADGVDDDLDGLIDSDDPDCDGAWVHDDYVAALYRDLLGREPDPAGMTYWAGELARDPVRSRLVNRIWRTPELRLRLVDLAYDHVLGRRPSPADRDWWSSWLARGRRFDDLLTALLVSPEMAARAGPSVGDLVARVVEVVLGRPATPDEVAAGAATVHTRGRTAFVTALLRGEERTAAVVDGLYRALLRRPAEPGGLAYWAGRLRDGEDVLAVIVALVASAEYHARAGAVSAPGAVLDRVVAPTG